MKPCSICGHEAPKSWASKEEGLRYHAETAARLGDTLQEDGRVEEAQRAYDHAGKLINRCAALVRGSF